MGYTTLALSQRTSPIIAGPVNNLTHLDAMSLIRRAPEDASAGVLLFHRKISAGFGTELFDDDDEHGMMMSMVTVMMVIARRSECPESCRLIG